MNKLLTMKCWPSHSGQEFNDFYQELEEELKLKFRVDEVELLY